MIPRWLRDLAAMLLVVGLLVGALTAYARTWPPAVIVESGSMMHADDDVSYGRFGTIDPGDLVVVTAVQDPEDIITLVEGGRERYGMPGDVIIYRPGGDERRTPIIHRAVAYVEVLPGGNGYDVRWSTDAPCEGGASKVPRDGRTWCRYGTSGVLIPSVPVRDQSSQNSPYRPRASGFLTKGDNPASNQDIDQVAGISYNARGELVPVPMEWIEGKGRGELPWLGLIKLAIAGKPNQDNPPAAWSKVGSAYAPKDLWVMLGVSLFVVVGMPFLYDGYRAWRARGEPDE